MAKKENKKPYEKSHLIALLIAEKMEEIIKRDPNKYKFMGEIKVGNNTFNKNAKR